jgi:hypothetical protein
MLMPDGRVERDMIAMRAASEDIHARNYGAAQIQVIFAMDIAAEDRDRAVAELMRGYRPLINALRSGAEK